MCQAQEASVRNIYPVFACPGCMRIHGRVHLIGVCLMGVHLTDVHLIGVYLMDIYPDLPLYKR
jgi:hypothetical protein